MLSRLVHQIPTAKHGKEMFVSNVLKDIILTKITFVFK